MGCSTDAMHLNTAPYLEQSARWPASGRHILAQYDDEGVVVYQAYRPSIGRYAAEHGYFGGEWSASRMTWIKPNFLWMMFRSGWGTKEGQEVTMAVTLRRAAFDQILAAAVASSYDADRYATRAEWQLAVKTSGVRLQWDPDHAPTGQAVERRAVQLGLRAEMSAKYAREWILRIEDISGFVAEQRQNATPSAYAQLRLPEEHVYPAATAEIAHVLGLSPP